MISSDSCARASRCLEFDIHCTSTFILLQRIAVVDGAIVHAHVIRLALNLFIVERRSCSMEKLTTSPSDPSPLYELRKAALMRSRLSKASSAFVTTSVMLASDTGGLSNLGESIPNSESFTSLLCPRNRFLIAFQLVPTTRLRADDQSRLK